MNGFFKIKDPLQRFTIYGANMQTDIRSKRAGEHEAGLLLLQKSLYEEYAIRLPETIPEDEIAFGAHGKPYLRNFPRIHFNISHSYGRIVCAFSKTPVGVDVERIAPVKDALLRRTLAQQEQQELQALVDEGYDRDEIFFRYWTAKESYLKYLGCGITRELRDVIISPRVPVGGGLWTAHCDQRERISQYGPAEGFLLSVSYP